MIVLPTIEARRKKERGQAIAEVPDLLEDRIRIAERVDEADDARSERTPKARDEAPAMKSENSGAPREAYVARFLAETVLLRGETFLEEAEERLLLRP